jgi:Ca2+/Na+ antiporter
MDAEISYYKTGISTMNFLYSLGLACVLRMFLVSHIKKQVYFSLPSACSILLQIFLKNSVLVDYKIS